MRGRRSGTREVVADVLWLSAGWALLVIVDVKIALFAGVPLACLGAYVRRRWWSDGPDDPAVSEAKHGRPVLGRRLAFWPRSRPLRGRIALFLLVPLLGLYLSGLLVQACFGPLAGVLAAMLLLGAVEAVTRRLGCSFFRAFPVLFAFALLGASVAFGFVLLESGLGRWPTDDFLKVVSPAPRAPSWPMRAKEQALSAVREALSRQAGAVLGREPPGPHAARGAAASAAPRPRAEPAVQMGAERAAELAAELAAEQTSKMPELAAEQTSKKPELAAEQTSKKPEPVAEQTSKMPELVAELTPKMPELVAAPSPSGVYVTLFRRDGYRSRGFDSRGQGSLAKVLKATGRALQRAAHRPTRMDRAPSALARSSMPVGEDPQHRRSYAWIQIDVAGRARGTVHRSLFAVFSPLLRSAHSSLEGLNPLGMLFSLAYDVEPGVDGLRLSKQGRQGVAVMLPAEPVTYGWLTPRVRSAPAKLGTMLSQTWSREFRQRLSLSRVALDVDKFRTMSFGAPVHGPGREAAAASAAAPADKAGTAPAGGQGVVDWLRGNHMLGGLDRKTLSKRTALAADWLSRQVLRPRSRQPWGRFHYEVYPPYLKGTPDYSLPRHAGAVYGLLAFYRAANELQEPAFRDGNSALRALEAALRGLDYIARHLRPPSSSDSGELCFFEPGGEPSSGATALAAMALAELPAAPQVAATSQLAHRRLSARIARMPTRKWLRGLGSCMLSMVDAEGAVFRTYREARVHRRVAKEPLYFPGEVMLALVRSYRILGDERFLEGARRIGDRQLRKYRWFMLLNLARSGDHWIIQALSELARVTKERKYAELSVLMAKGYLREQYPKVTHVHPDYHGAYYRAADLPRTTRAASRGEALGGAVEAARFLGQDPSVLERGLLRGARHLIEQQLVAENSYFVPGDFDVQGAIRMGLVDNHCRIDNNQHGLVALLHALRAMDRRARRAARAGR